MEIGNCVAVAGYFKSLSTRDRVSNSVCQQEKTCHTGCTCRIGEDMLTLVSGAGRLNEAEDWSRFGAHCRRIGCSRDYYYTVKVTGKESVEKFICPHKEAAPHLTEDYAAAWKGEVPTRFRFA